MASSISPDIAGLRALSHPVRLRMLGLLRTEGPATATSLAQRLGLNTGATSYHLRQLAQHGFIEEDPERGTGRDRWWRAAHDATRTDFRREGTSDEDVEAYLTTVALLYGDRLRSAVAELRFLPQEWRSVGTLSDWEIPLTPAGADELVQALVRVIEETESSEAEDAAPFSVNLNAFPRPGALGTDPAGPTGERPDHRHDDRRRATTATRRAPLVGGLTAEGISFIGTRVSMIAIPWFVLSTTGSATQTGLVAAAEIAPLVLFKALGGPLLDRVGPRRVTLVCDLGSALVVGSIPLLHQLGALTFPLLLVHRRGRRRPAGTGRRGQVGDDARDRPGRRGLPRAGDRAGQRRRAHLDDGRGRAGRAARRRVRGRQRALRRRGVVPAVLRGLRARRPPGWAAPCRARRRPPGSARRRTSPSSGRGGTSCAPSRCWSRSA